MHGRRGVGYVYSSQFITDEQAERELREYVGRRAEDVDARFLKIRIGHNRKLWEKNCVAIGLAGGFIEPLESTGIALVTHGLELLRIHFPTRDFPNPLADSYNAAMIRLYEHIREFIVLHEDSEYWRANMRRRIAEVHAGAFAMTIDHVEFLRRQSRLAT